MSQQGGSPRRRVCLLGLGGGGFHSEAERLVMHLPPDVELVLVYSIHTQTRGNWRSAAPVHRAFVVRSPALRDDGWFRRFWSLIVAFVRALGIVLATRPDCILAVGTAHAVPFGAAARLTRVPLFYVESLTRVSAPSRTGRVVAALRLAACHYVQWERLAEPPRVRYTGSLLS